jgi:DNA-binding NarL/FixJ family response regulator
VDVAVPAPAGGEDEVSWFHGDPVTGALYRAADAGRQAAIAMFVPALLATRACLAAIAADDPTAAAAVAETRAALRGRHEAITQATLCYAEGIMAWHRGELAEAERLIRTATLQWHHCSDRMDTSDGIELLGALAAARERHGDAARLLAAADAARPRLGYLTPGFTADRRAAARAASHARHVLGEDSFAQAWEQGQGLTLDDAVTHVARRGGGRKRPATGWGSLTPTELQVVRLVAEGLRNDAIARRLFVSPARSKCTCPTSSPSSTSRPVPNSPHKQPHGPEDRRLSSSYQPPHCSRTAAGLGEPSTCAATAARRAHGQHRHKPRSRVAVMAAHTGII